MDAIGDHTAGGNHVPTSWRSGSIGPGADAIAIANGHRISLRVDNDGFGLLGWSYYDDTECDRAPICLSLSRGEAHELAWWVLRWWAAEWFGLRRRLYYLALRRHLAAYDRRRAAKEPSA